MMTTPLSSDPVFSHAHILLTAVVTTGFAAAGAAWCLGRKEWVDAVGIALAAGVSVFLWRTSANMPQLNADGLPMFSANDFLAPVLTYVFVSLYRAVRAPADARRFEQARALAVLASFAVNVLTI